MVTVNWLMVVDFREFMMTSPPELDQYRGWPKNILNIIINNIEKVDKPGWGSGQVVDIICNIYAF